MQRNAPYSRIAEILEQDKNTWEKSASSTAIIGLNAEEGQSWTDCIPAEIIELEISISQREALIHCQR
jgi:hypothetical protein